MNIPLELLNQLVSPFADVIGLAGADQPDSNAEPHHLLAFNNSDESCNTVFPDSSVHMMGPRTGALLFVKENACSVLLGPFEFFE